MPWLVWLGAGYILWLAWHIAVAGTPEEGGAASPPRFAAGFLLQFINVKVWLCGLTALSSFVLPQTTETLPVVGYSLALAFIGAGCNLIWGLAGDLLRGAFLRWGRRLNVALGAVAGVLRPADGRVGWRASRSDAVEGAEGWRSGRARPERRRAAQRGGDNGVLMLIYRNKKYCFHFD